jgi:hypothetical protein
LGEGEAPFKPIDARRFCQPGHAQLQVRLLSRPMKIHSEPNPAMGRTTKPGRRGAATPENVETFLASLDHPFKQEILALRQIILAADPTISEGIKWNVPSFRTSEYFATMNLRAKSGIGVILHFGAKKTDISSTGVAVPDPDRLLAWLGKDRAMVMFRDLNDIAERRSAFTALVREWIGHV